MKITIDIDRRYDDGKNVANALLKVERTYEAAMNALNVPHLALRIIMSARRSAHGCIHVDLIFPDKLLFFIIPDRLDQEDLEDMYLLLFRLAAGDDIRRVRADAVKFIEGKEIRHWLPAKEDYEKMKEGL